MACGGSSSSSSCSGCSSNCSSTSTGGNYNTPSYACNGNCTAVCGSCSSGCMGCTGGCDNACTGGCTSCSGCTNSCSGSCGTSCNQACSSYTSCACGSACTTTCRGSCTGSCSSGCTGCSSGCYTSCTTVCSSSCENACATGCTTYTSCGCGTDCSSSCTGTCDTTCSGTCKGGCSTSCTGGCTGGCTSCSGSCSGGCSQYCSTACAQACAACTNTCTKTCGDDCSGGCKQECSDDCTGTCTDNCKNNCSSTATTASCGVMCSGECMGCTGTCTASCADDCTNTCKDTCEGTCTDACTSCTGTCKISCVGSNSLLVGTDELEWIMPYVRNEIYRRSGFNEAGEFLHKPEYRHYSGPILSEPNDALFILDDDTEVIRVGHGIPVIDMLLKVCDFEDARFVREFDLIPGVYNMDKLMKFINFLRETPFDAPVSHCRGACTGLCDNNCTTTCVGSCLEECSSCGKMCSGMCSGACLGCSETCGKSCGTSCGDSCSGSVTGCAGCSSGCTGCTGCVNTCEGTCSKACISTCSGCSAGCFGTSGYNDTCGTCSSACTATCGGEAVSKSNTPNHYSVNLYHNGGLYGKLSTLYNGNDNVSVIGSVGDIVIPPFTSIAHEFKITDVIGTADRWISALNGSSLVCSGGTSNTLTISAGSPTEMTYYSASMKSVVLYSKAEVGLSFGIIKNTYTTTSDNDVIIVIDTDSLVNISAVDSNGETISGARTNDWAIYINSVEYAMPYTGLIDKGSVITLRGNNITYTVQRHKDEVATSSITIPFGLANPDKQVNNGFGVRPYCFCREMRIWFEKDGTVHSKLGTLEPCELADNPHARITSSYWKGTDYNVLLTESGYTGGKTKYSNMPDTVTITVTANEFKEMCEDGSYIGILYTAGFELYEGYNYGMDYACTYFTDGRYDSDLNVLLKDAETYATIDKVPLYRDNTSYEQYSFVIPEIPGYTHVTNYTPKSYPSFKDRAQEFQFNQQYTVYGRNSFVLFLHK